MQEQDSAAMALLIVKCVGCGNKEKVSPTEHPPMCGQCFAPMVAVGAES